MAKANDPAFPVVTKVYSNPLDFQLVPTGGLTKREYFAAMAMQGLLASGVAAIRAQSYEDVALHARRNADAVLEELERTSPS